MALTPTPARSNQPARNSKVAKPTPTDDDEEAEIRAILPTGAAFDLRERVIWHGQEADGTSFDAYGQPYTLKGRTSIAALRKEPLQLIWDLSRYTSILKDEEVWPIEVSNSAGIAFARKGAPQILILDLGSNWTFDNGDGGDGLRSPEA